MAEPISIQQLKDASEDAITLADFIYKPANVMIPRRLAADINSLQYYLDYMSSYAQHSYETYDEMVANAVNLPSGISAFVTNDLDATKNGIYTYNGTSFVKGIYQPENAAKDFVEAKLDGLQVFDGKVRTQDVSTADGSTQEVKNTEFRNELDALPFDGGVLADTFVTATKVNATAVARTQRDINSEVISVLNYEDKSGDSTLTLQKAVDVGGDILLPAKTYVISGDVTISNSTVSLYSNGSVATIKSTNGSTLIIKGVKTETKTFITATSIKPQKKISVASTAGFSVGDYVDIAGSPNEANNTSKTPQRELNIISAISGSVITLKNATGHTYTYAADHAEKASITKVTPLKDISLDSIKLDGVNLDFGYIDGFNVNNLKTVGSTFNSKGLSCDNVTFSNVKVSNNSTDNRQVGAELCGLKNFSLDITIDGGKMDGLRLWGCSDGTYHTNIKDAPNRSLWLYQSNNVTTKTSTISTLTDNAINAEVLLFDYSTNCHYVGTIYAADTGENASVAEWRYSKNCSVTKSELHSGSIMPLTIKGRSSDSVFKDNIVYCYSASATLVSYQELGSIGLNGTLGEGGDVTIEGNKIRASGLNTSITLMRTISTTQLDYDINGTIKIKDNEFDRGAGYIALLSGTGLGSKIDRFIVDGNTALKNEAGGALFGSDIPIKNMVVTNNKIPDVNTRQISLSNIDNLHLEGNSVNKIKLTNVASVTVGVNDFDSIEGLNATNLRKGEYRFDESLAATTVPANGYFEYLITIDGITTGSGGYAGDFEVNAIRSANVDKSITINTGVKAANTFALRLLNPTDTAKSVPTSRWSFVVRKTPLRTT